MPAISPPTFMDDFSRALSRLEGAHARTVSSSAERRYIRSFVGAWFGNYRSAFAILLGDEQQLRRMDDLIHGINRLASETSVARSTVLRHFRDARRYFSDNLLAPLTRAYWSRAPEATFPGRDGTVATRLRQLDKTLADSYEQAALDLEDERRVTYLGPAAELREILRKVLHILAPNERVQATEWYRQARSSGTRTEPTPTRKERVRFIIRSRGQGSAAEEAAESFDTFIEDRLGRVVDATYRRGSSSTHGGTERGEVMQSLRYMNALLGELLPPP